MVLVLGACHTDGCDTSGLDALSAKEPRSIDFPGVALGEVGEFVPMHALGRNGRLTAIAGMARSGRAIIVPRGGDEPCTVMDLPEGDSPSKLLPMALEEMLVTLVDRDDTGKGTLRIYNPRCEQTVDALLGARPVSRSERLVPLRLLVEANGGQLLAISASDQRATVLDEDVEAVQVTSTHVVTVAGGQLVVRDMALEVVAHHGQDVTEMVMSGEFIAYVDRGRLHVISAPEGEPKQLAEDVCSVRFADQASRKGDRDAQFLSFYSPCGSSELVVYELSTKLPTPVGPAKSSRAEARRVKRGNEETTIIFFQPEASEDTETAGLAVYADGAAHPLLEPGGLEGIGRVTDDGVALWLGEGTDESRIVRYRGVDDIEVVLSDVMAFEVESYPERALVATDEGSHLIALEGFASPTVIASDAEDLGFGSSTGSLFGSSVESGVGTLRMLRTDEAAVEEIASDVWIPDATLAFSSEALFYLTQYEPPEKRGDLCMKVLANSDLFCEPDATEFRIFIRPKRAVGYVKRVGAERRLFWAVVQ